MSADNSKLFRVSFSRSLLDYVAARVAGAAVVPVRLHVGPPVPPGAAGAGRLYAVVKARSGWPLRVTGFPELAELWRHPSRDVRECRVELLNR